MHLSAMMFGLLAIAAGENFPAPQPVASNTFIEWQSTSGAQSFIADNVTATITGRHCDTREDVNKDCIIPVVTVSAPGMAGVQLVGEKTSPGFPVSVAIGHLDRGQILPTVLLQTNTGGAHCCEHIMAAQPAGQKFKAVDMDAWDGEEISFPEDISGDGVADFVFVDNAFLYAFDCYACSYAPPRVFNIRDGRKVDVSRDPAFRRLYARDIVKARGACEGRDAPNGACPAYVADAARLGQFATAWAIMLKHYDRRHEWDYPDGCRGALTAEGECPTAQSIHYPTYPAALRGFLERNGYLPSSR